MAWTQEQRQVIDLRDCSLLVSAAAGSGKTAVLVERILSMLMDEEHPKDIDRLLIVTFTNAAAGEMKDRIRLAVEQKAEELAQTDPGGRMLEHLQRQISLLSNAQITTIHSFCQYVIRSHFHTIDLDPGLRVADEGELRLLQEDVLQNLLEECYGQGEQEFRNMCRCLAPGRDDGILKELALALYRFSRGFPFPEKWLEEACRAYEVDGEGLDGLPWTKALMEFTNEILREICAQIREAEELCGDEDGPYPYLDALSQDLQLSEELLAADAFGARCQRMQGISWARLSAKKDPRISEEKREQVKELREAYKKSLGDLQKEFFYASPEELAGQMRASAPMLKAMAEFVRRFAEAFSQEKRKRNLMDFDDMEHFALQILVREEDGKVSPTPVAQDFAEYFEEIFIDEYQDSNLVQELLLTSISRAPKGEYNLFMVGDVKQSIYRFRLARPELFMEKYRTFSTEGGKERRIDLHKNFRSRREVLLGVNYLFEQLMEHSLGSIDYDDAAALHPGAEFPPGDDASFRDTEVLIVDTKTPEGQEEAMESDREMEARAVAERIRAIVGKEKIWDKELGIYRPAAYGDIVVLLRTMQGWSDVFAKVLTDLGIPAHAGSRTGYFSATEVQTVLSLLRVIDNPRQDIPLTAVLHSPIAGLSGADLAKVKSRHPDVPFYEACMREESLQDFFAMLDQFRRMAVYTPMHELLRCILERTGYGSYAAAMPGGRQRAANLNMLIEKAIAYESGTYRGLYNFVRYIENLHRYDIDFGEAAVGDREDAVRILSIHQSKGLEFPVVFVCGIGKRMNQSDARASLIAHADFGIGCDWVDPDLRVRSATLLKRFIGGRIEQENLGEELRVLYVAMTRAKEKLILAGTLPNARERFRKWGAICRRRDAVLPFTLRAGALAYWDWILPALMRGRCFEELAGECGIVQDQSHPLFLRDAHIAVRVLGVEDLIGAESARQERICMTRAQLEAIPAERVFDPETAKRLEENLSFCYTYGEESAIPAKFSVSELKRMAVYEEQEDGEMLVSEPVPVPLVPEFLKKEHVASGAARGTAFHRVMECLDFALFLDRQGGEARILDAELDRLKEGGFLDGEEAALIDRGKICRFLQSPLALRMMRAQERGDLFRERQFVMRLPACEIRPGWPKEETVLVQGIIDAYFIEDGRIVLLDYKTDFVKREEASSLYDKYAVQLDCYGQALERLAHLPVKEKLIYSFCLDQVLQKKA